jgi:hypothetical protein
MNWRSKMDKAQAKRISTIYNRSVQSKAEIRAEGDAALEAFLKKGGVIQEAKPSRRKIKKTMSSKTTRFVSGTSGFANGYPRKSMGSF